MDEKPARKKQVIVYTKDALLTTAQRTERQQEKVREDDGYLAFRGAADTSNKLKKLSGKDEVLKTDTCREG